jgi:hypothetical protein
MKHRFVAKYDHDGKSNGVRRSWWEQGQQENGHSYFIMM